MKYFLRILLSPIPIVWSGFLLAGGTLFPLPLLVIMSIACLVGNFFIAIMKLASIEIDWMGDPLITYFDDDYVLNHLAGATIYLWLPFYITWEFIVEGRLFLSNEF